jgi:hypothetical protein
LGVSPRVKFVQKTMGNRRKQEARHKDYDQSAIERKKAREQFAAIAGERVHRAHAAQEHGSI